MEEALVVVMRELPSTGILALFLYMVFKQFDSSLRLISTEFNHGVEMMREHLQELNRMLAYCIQKNDLSTAVRRTNERMAEFESFLHEQGQDLFKKEPKNPKE